MKLQEDLGQFRLSATDLSNFLGCKHRAALEMEALLEKRPIPKQNDPSLEALFKRGAEHEQQYVDRLKSTRGPVTEFDAQAKDAAKVAADTITAMLEGADVITQGVLTDGRWLGRTDVLLRVSKPSHFGDWSYEVADTKLSAETKSGAILQVALYSALLEDVQGVRPDHVHIVTPKADQVYRLDDYAAYFRWVRDRLKAFTAPASGQGGLILVSEVKDLVAGHYPEPVPLCDICPWWKHCADKRRADDHLSLVAGITSGQRRELEGQGVTTRGALATMPLSFKPRRGAADSYVKVREQARVQVQAETEKRPVFELLPIVPATEKAPAQGVCRLPLPSPGDLFLDLEGDPNAAPTMSPDVRGLEYLFGLVEVGPDGKPRCQSLWAANAAEERVAFEAAMDRIMAARAADPGAHVYHYAPYEQTAFKRMAQLHVTRQAELDELLRAEAFVDLYAVVRQGVRAGVESYSIKKLEDFYGYKRDVNVRTVGAHLRVMELAVEQNDVASVAPAVRDAVQGYNREDCESTLYLRNWLESLRAKVESGELPVEGHAPGSALPRPVPEAQEDRKEQKEKEQRVEAVRGQLLGAEGEDRRLMAYLLDYHSREDKAVWWEYFRLKEQDAMDLLDEPDAVSGLQFIEDAGPIARSRLHRYTFPQQHLELKAGDPLRNQEGKGWGTIHSIDREAHDLVMKVGDTAKDQRPAAAFKFKLIGAGVIEKALLSIGESMVAGNIDPLALALLQRTPPSTQKVKELVGEVLPVQGPPGTGKTYRGAEMICELVKAGKRVGVCGPSHKVIQNLLVAVAQRAAENKQAVKLAHKPDDDGDLAAVAAKYGVTMISDTRKALATLDSGATQVLGGTAWLWSNDDALKKVDVLFMDEAGQASLANTLAVTRAAKAIVLLGDPQQLDQPTKGTHPEGVSESALGHILQGARVLTAEQGLFLDKTWRFGEGICKFTSPAFYEGQLSPTTEVALEGQVLAGSAIDGAGVFCLPVEHEGNRNGSDEEVAAIRDLINRLVAPCATWTNQKGETNPLTRDDILVVSPYNVQVNRLAAALPGVRCGTVDKFQGQEAAVSIYSMATSRPEEAPRGMKFLYSLNRLNVATSRARCVTVVVASPRLFAPECRTPEQMRLASALCWFREMAEELQPGGSDAC